ncbi:hypothetical protein [Paraburkholderia sp.]|uniref:hypothetical protein n=1 Tax=Paraburkholderia sp. TaxID=1926495 RepID=UPI00131D48D8
MKMSDCRIGYRQFWAPCATRFNLYKHGRDSSNLALANKRTRVDRVPVARSGNVIAQINREYGELYSWLAE